MSKQSWWALIIVVVASLCITGWTSGANTPPQAAWEYKIISTYGPSATNPPPNVNQLNDAGRQGWELIEIRAGGFPEAGSKQVRTDYYFKRVK